MMNKSLEGIQKRGGAWCGWCGIVFDNVINARKHSVEQHYDYVLAQCGGNKQRLLDFIKGFDKFPDFPDIRRPYPNNESDFNDE